MKQNTRIARLIRNKRVKKLANFATVALLVCPIAIGAVKALAENVEEPPAVEEVAPTEVGEKRDETTQNSGETSTKEDLELIPPTVGESVEQLQKSTDSPKRAVVAPEIATDSIESKTNEPIKVRITCTNGNTIITEQIITVPLNESTVITPPIIEGYVANSTFPPTTEDNDNQDFINSIVNNDYENMMYTISPNGASFSGVIYLQFGYSKNDPVKDAEIEQLSADIEALLTDLELITRDFEYRERYESLEPVYNNIISSKENYINSSGWDSWYSYAIPELQKNLSDLQALRNEIANDFKTLDEFGLDSSVLKDVLDKAEEVKANKEKYTPESFALFEDDSEGGTLDQIINQGYEILNKTYTIDQYYRAYAGYWVAINELNYRFDQLVLVTEPEVKVNVTINYVSSENGTINTLTQEAIEGKPFTATAPDTFTQSTGPKFYRTSDASQAIASASEGAVITFNYEKIMATMNDVIILGATTANVGETKDYIMESTTHFNYGDPRIDYLNFETNNPIVISDPSAAEITAGKIKFLKAGTYQLSGSASSEPLTVVVSEGTITPTPTIKSTEWIVTGETTAKQGETKAYGVDEKITYSDDSVKLNKNITIPKGYNLTSSNASDVITNNNIKFGEEGTREVTFTSKTKAITTITGLTVTVSKDTTVPNPEKPGSGGNNGSGTNTDNKPGSNSNKNNNGNNSSTNLNSKDQKVNNTKNNNSSNQESDKNLPQTGEKETYVMFLSGLVTLGGMLVAVIKRKRKKVG